MKRLKGFTLIELIIVMAIFSVIMFSAIQLITPVGKNFASTAEYESSRSSVDNISRYIQGTLRYADRVAIYNCDDVYDDSLIDSKVAQFAGDFFYRGENGQYAVDPYKEDIYVLMFDNSTNFGDEYIENLPENQKKNIISKYTYSTSSTWYNCLNATEDTSVTPSKFKYTFNTGYTKGSREFPINSELFEDFSFKYYFGNYEYNGGNLNSVSYNDGSTNQTNNINVGVKNDASSISITLDVMKPKYDSTVSKMIYTCLEQCSTTSFALVNAIDDKGTYKPDEMVLKKVDNSVTPSVEYFTTAPNEARFVNEVQSYNMNNDSFFIIYTLPKKY